MGKGKLFGGAPVGAVTLVEAPVSQWYQRRAALAFVCVSVGAALLAAAVVASFAPLLLAVVVCVPLGLVCGLVAAVLVRVWPVLRALWWWSVEIVVTSVVVFGSSALARWSRPWVALLMLLGVAVVCVAVPRVRRFLSAWSWCLVVRHRLRLCFTRLIKSAGAGRQGLLPLVLWARPTPAGERVWLWLRPGVELADLDGKTGLMAVTCWASQLRAVAASPRYAALVRVDIARRDPMTVTVPSPLALLIPALRQMAVEPESGQVPAVGLNLADIPEPAPEPRSGRR